MHYPYQLDNTLSLLIEANYQFIISSDLLGNINYFNDKSARQLKFEPISMEYSIKFPSLLNEQDRINYRKTVLKCMEKPGHSETLILHKIGNNNFQHGVQFIISMIEDEIQGPIGFLFIGQELNKPIDYPNDLTDKDSMPYEDLKILLRNKQIMVWMLDANQDCKYANDTIYNRFKSSHLQEYEKAFLNRFRLGSNPDTYASLLNKLHEQKEFSIEIAANTVGDQKIWLQIIGIPRINHNGFFEGFLLYGTDISVIHDASDSLKKQTELISILNKEYTKFKKIASVSNQAIMIADNVNKITWSNEAIYHILGYNLSDTIGKQDFQLFCGPDTGSAAISAIKLSVCDLTSLNQEILLYHKSGKKVMVELIKEPIYDENNKFCGFFIIVNNLHSKNVSEVELSKKMQDLKKMSLITSHEIRHEFTKIMQLTQTFKLHTPDLPTYQKLLEEIEKSTEKVNKAIFELNDQINFAHSNTLSLDEQSELEIDEIVLIDDDKLVNELNKMVIKSVHPEITVKVFDDVDYALSHIIANPYTKRKTFVDLNFPYKSGWFFLDEYQKLSQQGSVILLTSSLEQEDIDYSKQYPFITHYLTKPLNIDQLKELKIQTKSKSEIIQIDSKSE